MKNDYRVAGKIWIARGKETFLGYGRIKLLERIREHGSISAAARSMGMGYRHAWRLVDSMNKAAPEALVKTVTGGAGGGGAKLTGAGERAIELFWRIYKEMEDFLENETRDVKERLK